MPKVLNAVLGTKFRVIAGYDPAAGLTLSIERREVEGICGLSWSTMKASRPHWIKDKLLNVIVQLGMEKLPDLPQVPAALDIVKDPHKKRVLTLILMRQETGRPVAAPPGVPEDRLAALRRAFDATMKDPAFIAEAEKLQLEIEPMTGAEIQKMLAEAFATPKDDRGGSRRAAQAAGAEEVAQSVRSPAIARSDPGYAALRSAPPRYEADDGA